MKVIVNPKVCRKYGISPEEAVLMIAYNNVPNVSEVTEGLRGKGFISKKQGDSGGYFLTDKASGILTDIIFDSSRPEERDLTSLCEQLKKLYPKGSKDVNGKKYYWADSVKLIKRRIEIFFRLYGEFPDEDIIEATKRYVDSFDGDYSTMKLLKYFIFREKSFGGGVAEPSSDLLNYIENKDMKEVSGRDWTSRIR